MNDAEPAAFNLIDEPWLPIRTLTGEPKLLSLADALAQAHDVSGLACEVGTQVFSLTRLLLAVLHGALDGPRDIDDWEQLWQQDRLPAAKIQSYLDRYRDRFDLFHPDTPFLQVAGLRTAKGDVSELNKLVADVPNGHPFFTIRLGGPLRLSCAEAARWLVHCHAFDPSGIKSGAEGDPRVKGGRGYPIGTGWSGNLGGVLPEGPTLRETLLLNLIAADSDALRRDPTRDLPAWERDPTGPAEEQDGGRAPTGPVDLYTWQSRRIRLVREDSVVTAVLICNGERSAPQNKNLVEPHTAWRRSQAQEKKLGRPLVYMPREHLPERAVWRGLQSLLPGAEKGQGADAAAFLSPGVLEWIAEIADVIGPDYPVRLHTVGMVYGAQSSTTADILDDHLELRSALISRGARALVQTALDGVAAAEKGALAAGRLASNLAAAAGAGKDERDGPRARASERAYADLDIEFRAWLRDLRAGTDPMNAAAAWHATADQLIRSLGKELLEQAPMTAWSGRIVNGHLLTSSHADRYFRDAVKDAFPFAYPETTEAAS